jgi:peptidylprolyl isomerase
MVASLFILSCEGNKSKQKKEAAEAAKVKKLNKKQLQQKRRDSLLKNLKVPSDGSETDVDIDAIKKISQKKLIPFLKKYGAKNPETHATISTSYGKIEIELFKDAPLHRANFVRLGKMGYFGTTVVHRIDSDFVVQMGNSENKSTSNIRKAVGDFLIPNEYSPKHKHTRGKVSMAKFSDQNVSNASSPFEFFIVIGNAHHLDVEHTVFGEVVNGMNVVGKIAKADTGDSEWPIESIPIEVEIGE